MCCRRWLSCVSFCAPKLRWEVLESCKVPIKLSFKHCSNIFRRFVFFIFLLRIVCATTAVSIFNDVQNYLLCSPNRCVASAHFDCAHLLVRTKCFLLVVVGVFFIRGRRKPAHQILLVSNLVMKKLFRRGFSFVWCGRHRCEKDNKIIPFLFASN